MFKRWSHWPLLAILLLAFTLRVYKLGDQNIWWDEGYSVYVARHPLGALTTVAAADTHPPLYYWLLHLWMGLEGQSEFALRFPSLAFGVLAVALVYRLGCCLSGGADFDSQHRGYALALEVAPLVAAFLLTVNRFHIWWSQEIRMYGLATMWAAASMWTLIRHSSFVIRHSPFAIRHSLFAIRHSSFWLYALTVAAGMYSLYLFIFVVAAEGAFVAWMAWSQWRRNSQVVLLLVGWCGAAAAAGLAMVPWLLYTLPRLKSWSAASEFSSLTYLRVAWTVLTLGLTEHVERYSLLNLAFAVVIVAGAVAWFLVSGFKFQTPDSGSSTRNTQHAGNRRLHRNTQHDTFVLAVFVLAVPILGIFALLTLPQGMFYRPPLEARYQLLAVPALCILLAGSVLSLWRWRKLAGLLAAVVVLVPIIWVLPGYYRDRHLRGDFRTMTRAIEAYAEPGDALVLVSGDRFPLFNFRYDLLSRRDELPDVRALSVRQVTPADVEQWLAPLARTYRRVWLAEVEGHLQDPEGLLVSWLDQNRHVVWREEYDHNRLTLYGLDKEPPVVAGRFRESLQGEDLIGRALFMGYDLAVCEVRPGDVARLVVYFKVEAPFTLTVSLEDAGGRVLESRADWIEPPAAGVARLRFDVPVYARTPPGEYRFVLSSPGTPHSEVSPELVEGPGEESLLPATETSGSAQGDTCVILSRSLRVAGTSSLEAVTSIPNPLDARLGEFVHLVGHQSPEAVKPGDDLRVKLYWRMSSKLEERYTVFVQLVGTEFNPQTNGPLWAGHDSEPLDGGYPTTQWFVSVPVADMHTLTIPPDAPSGEYELWAGMYTLPDVKRLPIYDSQGDLIGDHVVLGKVKVE